MVFCDGGPRVNTIRREKPERNIENETFVETRVSENTTKTEFHKKKRKKAKKIWARETSSIPLHESHPSRRELLSLTIVEWVRWNGEIYRDIQLKGKRVGSIRR